MKEFLKTSQEGITLISTPFLTLFTRGQLSRIQFESWVDQITTFEYFSTLDNFYNKILSLNSSASQDKRYFEMWYEFSEDDRVYSLTFKNESFSSLPIESRFFDESEGVLVFFLEGNFEIIRNEKIYSLFLTPFGYSKDKLRFTLTEEQIKNLQKNGLTYIYELARELRLSAWEHLPIWVTFSQAKVIDFAKCSFAIDGSEYYYIYDLIPAKSKEQAHEKYTQQLKNNYLEEIALFEIKLFEEENWNTSSELSGSIISAAHEAFEYQQIRSNIIPPYFIYSLLVTPEKIIISHGDFKQDYWSSRFNKIKISEWYPDKENLFLRLLELSFMKETDRIHFDKFCNLVEEDEVHFELQLSDKGTTLKKMEK